jgi:acetyltransferase
MSVRNLGSAVHPKSIAVVGASPRPGSVGRMVLDNIISGGFAGPVYPVNPNHAEIAGLTCYASAGDLPEAPDFAVILTPASAVPGVITELAEKGCRAAVVITAGLTRANGLRQAMLDAAKPHLFRIIGPNTLGLIVPPLGLNASFSHIAAKPGSIALLSQSGAIVTTLVDWAADKAIGFSHVVSLGDMADVDVADYLDILAGDPRTKAVVLYLESIPNPRKFMSAARACARIKPVIAIKAGRHAEAAKAALTHTGALSGADRVTDAALRRAGILRVIDLDELFGATQTIGGLGSLSRARVGIVTNGGGAGVLAVDQLIDRGSDMAELSEATISGLDPHLPANWSRANPVDIVGDAPPERYRKAIEAVAADPGVDVVIVMNCPTALASPIDAATMLASICVNGRINGKPVLGCWLGQRVAAEGRAILEAAGVASYETPADVAAAVSYLVDWSRAQAQLTRVPEGDGLGEKTHFETVRAIFKAVAADGRSMLTEPEAKAALAAYAIAVPETLVAATPAEAGPLAAKLLEKYPKIAVKLLSRTVTHKSDVGGVVLNLASPEAAVEAASAISRRLGERHPGLAPDGFSLQPMIVRERAEELILGVSRDSIFGPVILFGAGGVSVEVVDDTAIGLPPLDEVLSGDLIDATRISRLLKGYRDRKPADRAGIIAALDAISRMIVDFPAIVSMDINPLLADSDGVIALDARIEIDPARVGEAGPNPDLAIRPWPSGWERTVESNGQAWLIRPILPSDVSLYPDFLARVSEGDIRLRFLSSRPNLDDQMLTRLTQLDYDREMAFVLLDAKSGALCGIARLSADPDHERGDFAILVRSDLQGRGLGWALMEQLVAWGRADGLGWLDGRILSENRRMIAMCQAIGFAISDAAGQPDQKFASLRLSPAGP